MYLFNPSPEQYAFASRGFFEDVRPLMILPEVASPDVWRGGLEERFQDDAKRTVFAAGLGINTMGINIKRHRELGLPLPDSPPDILKPEYKQQMVAWELRFGSGGSNYLGWWNFKFGARRQDRRPGAPQSGHRQRTRDARGDRGGWCEGAV